MSKNSAWMFKDQRDFRYKIYKLINDIANKENREHSIKFLKNQK